jgi:Tol biopolymer transport system component
MPSVSPDGKSLVALYSGRGQVAIYEFATEKRTVLEQLSGYEPKWARDSSGVYFGDRRGDFYRYQVASRKTQSVGKDTTATAQFWEGVSPLAIGPEGELLVIDDVRTSQLYAMKRQGW